MIVLFAFCLCPFRSYIVFPWVFCAYRHDLYHFRLIFPSWVFLIFLYILLFLLPFPLFIFFFTFVMIFFISVNVNDFECMGADLCAGVARSYVFTSAHFLHPPSLSSPFYFLQVSFMTYNYFFLPFPPRAFHGVVFLELLSSLIIFQLPPLRRSLFFSGLCFCDEVMSALSNNYDSVSATKSLSLCHFSS